LLTYLSVSNLAIIDRLELELEQGLTVLTGETGAGKTMLLNAIILLMGGRLARDQVRTGEELLTIEGSWESQALSGRLAQLGGDDGEDEVIVRRAVKFSGGRKKDRLFVGGQLCTRSRLQELAPELINISSQHEYVSLLKRSGHIHILDRFGKLEGKAARVRAAHEEYSKLNLDYEAAVEEAKSREERMGQLTTTAEELGAAELSEGMEEELRESISRLNHAVEIGAALQSSLSDLYEADDALISGLVAVERRLVEVAAFESRVSPYADRLAGVAADVEDVVAGLRELLGVSEFDPQLLDHMQERLAALEKLKRRYSAATVEELIEQRDEADAELLRLGDLDLSVTRLLAQRDEARGRLEALARELHNARERAGKRLEKRLARVLATLEMKKAEFRVGIDYSTQEISPLGGDQVEFLFSANPGEEPRPLRTIASGGELSRVLLAFKAVLADAYPVPTYIFDEIDAGIGGRTALAVGKLLATLAAKQQVICITHSAQLAAHADHHYVVTKVEKGGKTFALFGPLESDEERAEELARMISGLDESQSALEHARELLDAARKERGGLL